MSYIDTKYTVIGTDNEKGITGFIYMDTIFYAYDRSSETCVLCTSIPMDKVFRLNADYCRSYIREINRISPKGFSNLKVVKIETKYDFETMIINTKWYEVMDNDEHIEMGVAK